MIHSNIALGIPIDPDPEYLEYLQCQHLYGGMTPNERAKIDNYTLMRDWYFFAKELQVRAKKNKSGTASPKPDKKTFGTGD